MSQELVISLDKLPIEFIYRILDYLDDWVLITSFYNVSKRLNRVVESYRRYQEITGVNVIDGQIKRLSSALKALRTNKHVKVLRTYRCYTEPDSVLDLWGLIEINTTLQILSVTNLLVDDYHIGHLARALAKNRTLTSLTLTGNELTELSAESLSNALRINETLQILNLDLNLIGDEGVRHLSDALNVNKTLTVLNLRSNKISTRGVRYLLSALKINKTIHTLNLGSNRIEDGGIEQIADFLRDNTTLVSLDLSENDINYEAGMYLINALFSNTVTNTLKNLNIIWNGSFGWSADLFRNNGDDEFVLNTDKSP